MAIEFVSFIPTKDQKYLGIATVKIDNKYIFRYKITPNKDGNGFFPTEAAYKVSETGNAREDYIEAFMLDSNFEIQEIRKLIQNHVRNALSKQTKTQLNGSLHDHNDRHNDSQNERQHGNAQTNHLNAANSSPVHFEDVNLPF